MKTQQVNLTQRQVRIVRAALDVFSDLVEDSSIAVEGIKGDLAGGRDAAEIVRLMGKFKKQEPRHGKARH